jgi:hypothetical protein
MSVKTPIKFFAGRSSTYLAEKIARGFGQELGRTSFYRHAALNYEGRFILL